MTDHERGQVEAGAAEVYDELFVPALFGRFSLRIADLAGIGPADSVLDVACGTGAMTRALRDRTAGRVMGIDINPEMLAVARKRGGAIEYGEADAVDLPVADREFDVACCQFGLMFFPEPGRAVAELARVADRGIVAVWDAIDASSGYLAMQGLFKDQLGEQAAASIDTPFAMGEPGILEGVLADGGVERFNITAVEGTGRFDSIAQWVTTEIRGWTLGESVDDEQLSELVTIAEERLAEFATPDGAVFGITARVGTWMA